MKRIDLLALPAIALFSVFFGYKLFINSTNKVGKYEVKKLENLTAFEIEAAKRNSSNTHQYLLAQQWEWSNELELQEGKEYILHIATSDVQHGFHLQKQTTGESVDILIQPGFEYIVRLENLKEGIYAIGCTEYCGMEHNRMRTKLIISK